jgi:hypothetical protein
MTTEGSMGSVRWTAALLGMAVASLAFASVARADFTMRPTDRRAAVGATIAALIPAAIEAGLGKREIARLTSVSRVWIDELLRRRDTH